MFRSINQVLRWYYENEITLCNASSIDLTRLRSQPQRPKKRALNLNRLETHTTISYYLSRLSKTAQVVITCYYGENMSSKDIARLLNDAQNTRNYSKRRVEEMYHQSLKKLSKRLTSAGVISDGRGAD